MPTHAHEFSYGAEAYIFAEKKLAVKELIKMIHATGIEFESVAMIGLSQISVGCVVAFEMNKECLFIRKSNDQNHSGKSREGAICDTYIIIDDFISFGDSIMNVCESLPPESKCVGIFLYSKGSWTNSDRKNGQRFAEINGIKAEHRENIRMKDIPVYSLCGK